jgi:hypothetical protein
VIKKDAVNRLLVEGLDDEKVIIHLMKRHNIDWDGNDDVLPYVYNCKGINPLLGAVTAEAKSYPRLGIIMDADANVKNRWQQLKTRLSSIDITIPDTPGKDGTIVQGFYPDWKVGIWVMPDNVLAGRLEDFLSKLIPSNDSCWGYAGEVTNNAGKIGAKFPQNKLLDAQLYTWLAWQKEPGLPFGTAVRAAYFNVDSQEAIRFVEWFKRFFTNSN